MAFLMTYFWPGGTMDQYSATVAVLHPPTGLPEGQLHHAAGPTDGGVLVAAAWESKGHFERFLSETVMVSMPIDGGLTGQPEQRTAEIANVVTRPAEEIVAGARSTRGIELPQERSD